MEQEKDLDFAERLVRLRLDLPLRDAKPVEKKTVATEAGVSIGSYSLAENGVVPGEKILTRLARYFGVTEDYLLGKVEKPTRTKVPNREYPYGGVFNKEKTGCFTDNTQEKPGLLGRTEHIEKDGIRFAVTTHEPRGAPRQPPEHKEDSIKISEALTKTAEVLESGTSYATALHLNIVHFHRAILAESEIAELRAENKELKTRIERLEDAVENLIKERKAVQENRKTVNASSIK